VKKFFFASIILLLVSCRGPAPNAGQFPGGSPRERRAAEEALETKNFQDFLHQNKKDELQKLTENSFFDSRLKPLAGRPVLLAAGVKTWDRRRGESDEAPNVVKFEIIQGKGTLAFFTEYFPGQPVAGLPKTQLQTLAMDGYEAFVWVITDPDSHGEVVVRASLAPVGMRAAFIDPQSEILFHVNPVPVTAADKQWDVRKICGQTYENDSKPHAETADNFIFTYPSSIGVYKLDQTASLYAGGKLKLWRKNLKGLVAEAEDWEEKHVWKWEREKWHTLPPDLLGLLTHVDDQRRLGVLSYSQYDPVYGGQGNDQFRQGRWQLGEYLTKATSVEPEDLWTLKTEQEDVNSPLAVEVSRTRHTNLQQNHGAFFWGETIHWICSTGNLGTVYDMLFKKINYFQAGRLPSNEELKTRLAQTPKFTAAPSADKPINDFLKSVGFSFQDITPKLESRFHKLGHPPGPVVTKVDSASALALSGLLPNDVILMVNWEQTTNALELQKVLGNRHPAEMLTFVFWRQGSYHWVEVKLP
jgi:hypothetical protein